MIVSGDKTRTNGERHPIVVVLVAIEEMKAANDTFHADIAELKANSKELIVRNGDKVVGHIWSRPTFVGGSNYATHCVEYQYSYSPSLRRVSPWTISKRRRFNPS